MFRFPKLGDKGCILVFVFVGGKDREDGVAILGDEGREADDVSNSFATKFVHRRMEDEGRLLVVGEGVGRDDSCVGEEVNRVLSLDGVSVADSGDEIESFGLLRVLGLRNRTSERIRARGESRPFTTRSLTLRVSSRKSGVLLFNPRDSTGRRLQAPSKLIDRLWREFGPFVLLNDGNLPLLSKNGTSMTGSSFDTTFVDGVQCKIGDAVRRHESDVDQVRGMGDEAEDGKATVEIVVGVWGRSSTGIAGGGLRVIGRRGSCFKGRSGGVGGRLILSPLTRRRDGA